MTALAFTLGAYVLGSIPTGVLLGRIVGVDVRAEGSGNIGATNVARTAGRALGIATLLGDALKGLTPVLLARWAALDDAWVAAVGLAALFGHVFSMFLGFRGGKGVATGLGALVGLAPAAVLLPLAVFILTMAASRIVSLSSMLAAVSAPIALAALRYPASQSWAVTAMAALILLRHRENISRLLAGTEKRFESRK